MTMFKKELVERFNLSEAEVDLLTEEQAETLVSYLIIYDYNPTKRFGWVYPDGGHFWELESFDHKGADLYFNLGQKDVILMEYSDSTKEKLVSRTFFVSGVRFDYLTSKNGKDVLYTTDFSRTDYVSEANSHDYFQAVRKKEPIPEGLASYTITANRTDQPYLHLMNIKNKATTLRRQLEATHKQDL